MFESPQEQRDFFFFSRVNFLCWLLFRYPLRPRVTSVARKRSRSFCQKRRWQVTAKHAYSLCMWLCMKWHGAWLNGVHDFSSFLHGAFCALKKSADAIWHPFSYHASSGQHIFSFEVFVWNVVIDFFFSNWKLVCMYHQALVQEKMDISLDVLPWNDFSMTPISNDFAISLSVSLHTLPSIVLFGFVRNLGNSIFWWIKKKSETELLLAF